MSGRVREGDLAIAMDAQLITAMKEETIDSRSPLSVSVTQSTIPYTQQLRNIEREMRTGELTAGMQYEK